MLISCVLRSCADVSTEVSMSRYLHTYSPEAIARIVDHEAIHPIQAVQSHAASGLHIAGPQKPVLPSHVGRQAAYKWHGPEAWPAARRFGDGSSATVIGLDGSHCCRIVVAQPAVTQSNHHVPWAYPIQRHHLSSCSRPTGDFGTSMTGQFCIAHV